MGANQPGSGHRGFQGAALHSEDRGQIRHTYDYGLELLSSRSRTCTTETETSQRQSQCRNERDDEEGMESAEFMLTGGAVTELGEKGLVEMPEMRSGLGCVPSQPRHLAIKTQGRP